MCRSTLLPGVWGCPPTSIPFCLLPSLVGRGRGWVLPCPDVKVTLPQKHQKQEGENKTCQPPLILDESSARLSPWTPDQCRPRAPSLARSCSPTMPILWATFTVVPS